MSRKIKLTQGKWAIVDDDDYVALMKNKWHASRFGGLCIYAQRMSICGAVRSPVRMHRQIMGAKAGTIVDHINHNGLDNRKENLRFCTPSQNMANRRGLQINSHSGTRGVTWFPVSRKWRARIGFMGRSVHLGLYANKKDAIKAYAEANKKYFGEFGGEFK